MYLVLNHVTVTVAAYYAHCSWSVTNCSIIGCDIQCLGRKAFELMCSHEATSMHTCSGVSCHAANSDIAELPCAVVHMQ